MGFLQYLINEGNDIIMECRGSVDLEKREVTNAFFKDAESSFCVIQETKWEVSSMRVVKCLASSRFGD